MGILAAVGGVLKAVSAPVTEYVKGRAARVKVKEEGKLKIELAKVEAMVLAAQREDDNNLTYDIKALDNMKNTWKDEYLTVVMTFPFILSFLAPFIDEFYDTDLVDAIGTSWEAVGLAPDWYQWSIIGVVAATFGLRWLFSKSNPLKKS